MTVRKGRDILGRYLQITNENGEVFTERYFKEIGVSVRVKEFVGRKFIR